MYISSLSGETRELSVVVMERRGLLLFILHLVILFDISTYYSNFKNLFEKNVYYEKPLKKKINEESINLSCVKPVIVLAKRIGFTFLVHEILSCFPALKEIFTG